MAERVGEKKPLGGTRRGGRVIAPTSAPTCRAPCGLAQWCNCVAHGRVAWRGRVCVAVRDFYRAVPRVWGGRSQNSRLHLFPSRASPPPARHQRGGEAGACRRVCVGWWGRDLHGGAGAACEWRLVGVRALVFFFYALISFCLFNTFYLFFDANARCHAGATWAPCVGTYWERNGCENGGGIQ